MKRKKGQHGSLYFPTQVQKGEQKYVKYWPFIFCESEGENGIAIAICKRPIKHSIDINGNVQLLEKTAKEHWAEGACVWKDDRYKISFEIYEEAAKHGQMLQVMCPVCGNPVDFRVLPSTTRPIFQT